MNAQLAVLVAKNEKAIFQIFSYDEYGSPSSLGTGFFISSDGKALTNLHVLKDAKFAYIRDYKGVYYQIDKIDRICSECDIAEFHVVLNNNSFEKLNLTYDVPPKASEIFVIGNPEGLESTVSKGIISSIREQDNIKTIQITASISHGSSGSPIMDMNGNVIGIASFGYTEGQNLNFGYWIGCIDKLILNKEYIISNNKTGNLYVINKTLKTQPNLILNSIEVKEKNTIVNLSFTNSSLVWGDEAFIFASIGEKDNSYYIENNETGAKFNIYDASIGSSPKAPTKLKLGETKRFKLYFPPIGDSKIIDIVEGTKGTGWTFRNINLSEYDSLSFKSDSFFNDFYFQTGLSFLASKEFGKAYSILNEYALSNKNNDYAQYLAGIISYILGNNLDAFSHIKKAIEINPLNSEYYFNLYYLNYKSENFDEALKNISSAIQLDENQPEYYVYRGNLHFNNKSWKLAIADYNKYIESNRNISYGYLFKRGIAKTWDDDKTACSDFEKAYKLCDDDDRKKVIASWQNKYCK